MDTYRRGLIVRGRFLCWDEINLRYVCRHCGARLNRKPYADPLTGELDHNRYVCGGPDEHEIRKEGDLMIRALHEWIEEQEKLNFTLLVAEAVTNLGQLYVNDGFEGYD